MQPHNTTIEIPYGYCHCGCGQIAPIAPRNNKWKGWTKGQPLRYIHGHNKRVPDVGGPKPSALCQCGCGQSAPLAKFTNTHLGHVQGQPVRFISGHQNRHKSYDSLEDFFWSHVTPNGTENCWEWQGPRIHSGYGRSSHLNKSYLAHRVSWEIHYGPIPDGLQVLHKCDNPPCCNPDHLFLGTPAINSDDKMKKGRHVVHPGERNGNSKLTDADVIEIRRLYAEGTMQITLAEKYGLSQANISEIVLRKIWRHIP